MRLSGRAFLGQVPLRGSRVHSLGQAGQTVSVQRWTDENGTVHEITYSSGGGAPMEHPFTPGETPEQYERIEATNPELAKQQARCAALQQAMLDAKARYDAIENANSPEEEAGWQTYSKSVEDYNKCFEQIDALVNYRDYGGTMPWTPEPTTYEWPKEVPTPESYEHQPPPVQTPAQPPPVASTDWRFEGCPPGTQRIVRGGACVPPGLLSTALNVPSTTTTPMSTSSSYLRGRIPAEPLYRGRF